jgi:tRNA(adenine34) deaminase
VSLTDDDMPYMQRALELAAQAQERGEVPVGAVVVCEGVIAGEGHNRRELDQDPTAHAEMLALAQASKALGRWRLSGCTLYVTLEPCFMCAGALVNARVDRLVFGAADKKAGAVVSLAQVCEDARLNHRLIVDTGCLAQQSGDLLRGFFQEARARTREQKKTSAKAIDP